MRISRFPIFSYLLAIGVSGSFFLSCSESNFAGSDKTRSDKSLTTSKKGTNKDSNAEKSSSENNLPSSSNKSDPAPIPDSSIDPLQSSSQDHLGEVADQNQMKPDGLSEADDALSKKKCEINLDYNPADVQCKLSVNGPNIWTNVDGWRQSVSKFKDRTANWISPLAATRHNLGMMCPGVPNNEILIYVSYVEIPAAGDYQIEALNDNKGTMRLWKHADSSAEAFNAKVGMGLVSKKVSLEKERYSIVIDGEDFGGASSVLLSIQDTAGKVIKNSTTDSSWCIFRVTKSTDVVEFVNKAAICRKCFTGVEPKP